MAAIDAFDDTLNQCWKEIGALFRWQGLVIRDQLVSAPAMKTTGVDLSVQPFASIQLFSRLDSGSLKQRIRIGFSERLAKYSARYPRIIVLPEPATP